MIEAFVLGLYLLILTPFLYNFGLDSPFKIFLTLFLLSLPGIYAMLIGAPFVPTRQERVTKMLKLAKLNSKKNIYDLGSGDGRFIFQAHDLGVKKAIGYELSVPLYIFTKFKSFFYKRADIRYKNFWKDIENFKDADVIFLFLLTLPMKKFEKKIWPHLKTGTLVISHIFVMPNITPIYNKNGIKVYKK